MSHPPVANRPAATPVDSFLAHGPMWPAASPATVIVAVPLVVIGALGCVAVSLPLASGGDQPEAPVPSGTGARSWEAQTRLSAAITPAFSPIRAGT